MNRDTLTMAARRMVRDCVAEARASMRRAAENPSDGWYEYGKACATWHAICTLARFSVAGRPEYAVLSRLAGRAGRAFHFITDGKLAPRHTRTVREKAAAHV